MGELTSVPRALFVDVDGTLLSSDLQLTSEVIRAVDECVGSGVPVVLSSGRPLASLLNLLEHFADPPQFVIASNGGIVLDRRRGETWVTGSLSQGSITQLVHYADRHQLGFCAYTRDGWVAGGSHDWVSLEARRAGIEPNVTLPLSEMTHRLVDGVCKIMLVGDPVIIARVRRELEDQLAENATVYISYPEYLEIAAPGVSKPRAIGDILSRLGTTSDDVAAIGDGENDLEMLRTVGLAIAVSNAVAEARAVAHLIVPSNDEDGVAVAIDAIVFGREKALALTTRVGRS